MKNEILNLLMLSHPLQDSRTLQFNGTQTSEHASDELKERLNVSSIQKLYSEDTAESPSNPSKSDLNSVYPMSLPNPTLRW